METCGEGSILHVSYLCTPSPHLSVRPLYLHPRCHTPDKTPHSLRRPVITGAFGELMNQMCHCSKPGRCCLMVVASIKLGSSNIWSIPSNASANGAGAFYRGGCDGNRVDNQKQMLGTVDIFKEGIMRRTGSRVGLIPS